MKGVFDTLADRRVSGSSIAEFGPVLFVLFLVLVFPLVDLLSMAITYTAGTMLNQAQLRLAVTTPASQLQDTTASPMADVTKAWQSQGMAAFASLDSPPKCTVSYAPAFAGSTDFTVGVTTTVVARPLLRMPMFPGVPGLGAPMTFQYYSERLLEDPRNAPAPKS